MLTELWPRTPDLAIPKRSSNHNTTSPPAPVRSCPHQSAPSSDSNHRRRTNLLWHFGSDDRFQFAAEKKPRTFCLTRTKRWPVGPPSNAPRWSACWRSASRQRVTDGFDPRVFAAALRRFPVPSAAAAPPAKSFRRRIRALFPARARCQAPGFFVGTFRKRSL